MIRERAPGTEVGTWPPSPTADGNRTWARGRLADGLGESRHCVLLLLMLLLTEDRLRWFRPLLVVVVFVRCCCCCCKARCWTQATTMRHSQNTETQKEKKREKRRN